VFPFHEKIDFTKKLQHIHNTPFMVDQYYVGNITTVYVFTFTVRTARLFCLFTSVCRTYIYRVLDFMSTKVIFIRDDKRYLRKIKKTL